MLYIFYQRRNCSRICAVLHKNIDLQKLNPTKRKQTVTISSKKYCNLAINETKDPNEEKISLKSLKKKPAGYWQNNENICNFLTELKQKLNLHTMEDWNLLTIEQIKKNGGQQLTKYKSILEIKCLGCPEGKNFFLKKSINHWKNEENVNNFIKIVKDKYLLKTEEDWNKLTTKQIILAGGNNILNKYSIYDIKCMGYPEGKLKFIKPKAFKEKINNLNYFLDQLREKYDLKTSHDWNNLKRKQIQQINGGKNVLKAYSLLDIKKYGCPDENNNFDDSYNYKPNGYWKDEKNIQNFLLFLKEKLKLESFEDWSKITGKDIRFYGGGHLLQSFSLLDIKCFGCPEGKFYFTHQSNKKTKGYWENKENIKEFLHLLKEKYNFNTPQDWNKLTKKIIQLHGGYGLLQLYSIYEIKLIASPEGKSIFKESKSHKPPGYWNNVENVKKFLELISNTFHFKDENDWNSLSTKQIIQLGGQNLFNNYNLFDLKVLGFPKGKNHFINDPNIKGKTYWDDKNNILFFLDKLKDKYQLSTMDDWNRISTMQIRRSGGASLFLKYSKKDLLNTFILKDNESSFEKNFTSGFRTSQRWLFLQVQKLFPGEEIVEDYFHSDISRYSGCSVQFDIYLVKKKIAFEYHGEHHYQDIPSLAPVEMHKERDLEKQKLCSLFGIRLIIIPYWWDNKLESLLKTIESS